MLDKLLNFQSLTGQVKSGEPKSMTHRFLRHKRIRFGICRYNDVARTNQPIDNTYALGGAEVYDAPLPYLQSVASSTVGFTGKHLRRTPAGSN